MLGLPEEFTPDFLARLEQFRLKTRRQYQGMGKGSHLSPRRGSSLEFSDFRHYSPGDDFRHIDWGLYGRTDKVYIRLYKEEEDLLTYVFLDASASMAWPPNDGKFRRAAAIALALAYVALVHGDRVVIRLLAGNAPATRPAFVQGRHRIAELAGRLAQVRPAGPLDFAFALARELVAVRRAGKVFVISDYLMMLNSLTRGLGLFTAANMDVTAVQVLGAAELSGEGLAGDLELVDAESGEHVRVAIGPREREQHRAILLRLSREIRTFCARNGMRYTLHTTDQDFHDLFLRAVSALGLVR